VACGSQSFTATLWPASASADASKMESVVFPEPPFPLQSVIVI
jgi:hypothetical protein